MKIRFSTLIIVLFTLLTTTVSKSQINYGLIPASCQVDWTNAGLLPGTSFDAVDVYSVVDYGAVPNDGQNDYSAVVAAINAAQAAAGLSIVYFPAGTYNINSTINLSRTTSSMGYSDIVLQGAGSDETLLRFTVEVPTPVLMFMVRLQALNMVCQTLSPWAPLCLNVQI